MSFTPSMSTRLRLREIVDSYRAGRVCLDEFLSRIKHETRQLENFLLTSNHFLLALDEAQNYLPTEGRPLYTSMLANAHAYRITLLGIPRNLSIPLHDHPNMVSIVVFLSGRIKSSIYRVVSMERRYNLTELMNCSEETYSQGDIAVLTPDACNLHSMEAVTAEAVCLSIQLSVLSEFSHQFYYFPAVPESPESKPSLWYRVPFRRRQHAA